MSLYLKGQYQLDSYGNMGFRFADMSHQGSLLILPQGMYNWQVADGETLEPQHFKTIIAEANNIDMLILGLGKKMYMPPKPIRELCKKNNITIDFMSTSNAARTYNVLLSENRRIAAALIAIE